MLLPELLSHGAPDRPAVSYKDETLTYRQLSARVAGAAAVLRERGLAPGERVLVYLEKRLDTVIAMFAVSLAGGVLVPVNPVFKPQQVGYVAADCAARFVITSAERAHTLDVAGVLLIDDLDGGDGVTGGLAQCDPATGADTEVAAIFYTSGSTGGPKGVVLSHRNLVAGARSVAGYLGHTDADVILSVLPLSFDAGFSQLTTAFIAGAHVVLVNYLLPREVIRLCTRHQVTALTCVPPLWIQLAGQRWPAEATASLRYFANTGGRMPRATLARLREHFPGAAPYLMYGLTEAFRSTYLAPAQVDRRPDSIGAAIPDAQVLVVRPDGTECAPLEHGEIVHRGALVSLGYWNDPARTAERFRPFPPGGTEIAVWSGDVAYRDEEGYLYFVGRTDDMIKTSGYRVSPTEIEEAAYASGLVGEAVALGVADEQLGQHVVLVATGVLDVDTLRKSLERDLPKYMVPKVIVERDVLPRSANGKFDRGELRRSLPC